MSMTVHASDLTRRNIPIVDRAAELHNSAVQNLYVISPEDILTPETQYEFDVERQQSSGEMTNYAYFQHHETYDFQSPYVLRKFLDNNYPELSGQIDDEFLYNMAQQLISGAPAHTTIDNDITNRGSDAAIILTSYGDSTKASEAQYSAKVVSDEYSQLPGTDSQWREATFLHELGHLDSEPYTVSTLREEAVAESNMHDDLPALFSSAGQVESTQDSIALGDAIHAMRAIAVFNNGGDAYLLSAPVTIEGESAGPVGTALEFTNSAHNAIYQAALDIGNDIFSVGSYIEGLQTISSGYSPSDSMGPPDFSVEDISVFEKMIANPESMFDFHGELSEEAGAYFMSMVNEIDYNTGLRVGLQSPQKMYEAVRNIYLGGLLDDDPRAKRYAHEYLVAVQKYMPSTHEADVNEVFEAPVFDQSGQYVPTVEATVNPHQ